MPDSARENVEHVTIAKESPNSNNLSRSPSPDTKKRLDQEEKYSKAYKLAVEAKKELNDADPELYQKFASLLFQFQNKEINTPELMREILSRFYKYPNAMLAVQASLPAGCHMGYLKVIHKAWIVVPKENEPGKDLKFDVPLLD